MGGHEVSLEAIKRRGRLEGRVDDYDISALTLQKYCDIFAI